MVEQYIPEHPFVRHRELVDEVLGSVVLAHAIANDNFGPDLQRLDVASRLPFLWRSRPRRISDSSLLDGRYVGFALNSFWTDPITEDKSIAIRSSGDDVAAVRLSYTDANAEFSATLPLSLVGQARDATVDIRGSLVLQGQAFRGSQSAFYFYGASSVRASSIDVAADVMAVEGEVWLESEGVTSRPTLNLVVKNGSEVGWGGRFASSFPWNRHPSTLRRPDADATSNLLDNLVADCARRLPDGGALTLNEADLSPADVERMGWLAREYGEAFPKLIRLMIAHGLATTEDMAASGARKVRAHFDVTWKHLQRALRNDDDAGLRAFISEVRAVIDR